MGAPFLPARRYLTLLIAMTAAPGLVCAAAEPMTMAALSGDLTDLSLDELLDIDVMSVSMRPQPLSLSAAAVFVVTGDEIRNSGVRTLAEAMRLVPGLLVTRPSAQGYAVTSRGFSGDKLQVLFDGRSVYTPLSSTVFWDVLDTYLGDIDRIEVIRGPGATLWGANAVNGVINIITKDAAKTAGTQVTGGAGTEELAFGAVRSGSKLGEHGNIRLYAKARELDSAARPDGSDAPDGMRIARSGFRSDSTLATDHRLNLSGDVYNGVQTATGPVSMTRQETDLSGGNLSARWSYATGPGSDLSVMAYYDRYKRFIPEVFSETRDTADLSLQHRFSLGDSHNLVYGAGYRYSKDETGGPPLLIVFDPASRDIDTYNAFVQDQIAFGDSMTLTLGSKFEYNDFTGNEIQPGIRFGWQAAEQFFTWASVARAVRTPNRLDHDIAIFCAGAIPGLLGCTPGTVYPIGSRDFDSEKLIAYELGWRFWGAERRWSVDIATFFNDYEELKSSEGSGLNSRFQNNLEGHSYGSEISLAWRPLEQLDLRAFYGFLRLELRARPGSTDVVTAERTEGSSPRNQAGLRISTQPLRNWRVDSTLRYVDHLPTFRVPAYTELDLRLAWTPLSNLEVALVGHNLLDRQHPETGTATAAPTTELERAGLIELIWSWQ